ncbi:MAG: hypothetical protein V4685_08800 [Bacteroidota bacterium]
MKKLMTLVTAAALLLSTSSFAVDTNKKVNEKALSAFAKAFSGATNVHWTEKDDYYLVEFKVGDTRFNVAYDEEGIMIASSKSLELDELPLTVKQAVNNKYPGYEVGNNAVALTFEGQTDYLLTISNTRNVLHIKVSGKGSISVEQKTDL